ncbi:MAG TPA: DNA primase, partial [Deltaproteobacteria bacterium]|nr:DNA primase [Deltaproteobacteria bacterium]
MPKYSREFLTDLADRTSMVEVVSRHVQLKKRGSNWLGLCPFHQEKTPSFNVSEPRKAFKCFGCGEGGDAIAFLEKIQGMSFHEAVEELAGRAGMELPKETFDPQAAARSAHRDKLFHANNIAADYFARTLASPLGAAGRTCLEERAIETPFAQSWQLGVAPDAWDGLSNELQRQGVAPRIAEEAGLVIPRKGGSGYYDRFRNRLMFPIKDPRGRVVAFGGRTLGDDDAKYINSPESPVYNKSSTLYGLH